MISSRRLSALVVNVRGENAPALLADYEFDEYIHSMRTSSDRTRWILYILIISVAVLFAATWNIRETGWSGKHVDAWKTFKERERALTRDAQAKGKPTPVVLPRDPLLGEPQIHEEYMKEYVRRMLLVEIPLVGVAVDVNDIGTFGGLWLSALLLLLAMAVSREHENLCLALFKIRRVSETERRPNDGESKANLLYHGIAMTEMLCHPPTLARGHCATRTVSGWFLHSMAFLPALHQFWVIRTSWDDMKEYALIGDVRMQMQLLLLVIMLILGAKCLIYLEAMSDRWRKTFSMINPEIAETPVKPWWKWVRLNHTFPTGYAAARSATAMVRTALLMVLGPRRSA